MRSSGFTLALCAGLCGAVAACAPTPATVRAPMREAVPAVAQTRLPAGAPSVEASQFLALRTKPLHSSPPHSSPPHSSPPHSSPLHVEALHPEPGHANLERIEPEIAEAATAAEPGEHAERDHHAAHSQLVAHPSEPAMSLGKPNAGALINGVQMPEGPHWEIIDPRRAFATPETIDYLVAAIDAVEREHGHVHPLWIGHLSDEDGGRLWPHRSHQSGRDVDLSYYYVPSRAEWYRPATAGTLDLPRTWSFVRALLTDTDVELILIDRKVQRLLKKHALAIGEDREWLDSVFQYRSRTQTPVIKHAWGHRTHIHVRFRNPRAELAGYRAFDHLVSAKTIMPRHYTVSYRARGGDSLASLASKAGTSPDTFVKLNGTGAIQPGRVYHVPMRGQVARIAEPTLPPRRLPPTPSGARTRGIAAGEM
jgi:murein endopeptidase